jgi:hypothetical protein
MRIAAKVGSGNTTTNPMLAFGPSPIEGVTCTECKHLRGNGSINSTVKPECELRGKGKLHNPAWPACSKFLTWEQWRKQRDERVAG